MATSIKSTQLDFDTIKSSLKEFLKSKSEFADYDFEASGLSNILDVLAYNTHYNGLLANFAINESFINTAQLRSSLVSHAESIGYVPRSYTSAQAKLNVNTTVTGTNKPTTIELPRGTQFVSTVDNVSYTFRTREDFIGSDDGTGFYQFVTSVADTTIPVFEGVEKTKTFFVGEVADSQIYVIPDVTIDTSTIRVRVYDSANSLTFTTYTNITQAIRITNDSTFYQIKEVPNGYYEIIFGDGISSGKAPIAGNKVVIDYLSTTGTAANGAATFSTTATISIDGSSYAVNATTSNAAAGGAYKESIESIRQNAPIAFSSQRRLVTAEDYKAQILANYGSYLLDVIAWGGHDNVPQVYGRVYAGLQFKANIDANTQQSIKDAILTTLSDNLSIMSIDLVFADVETTSLQLSTTFNLDPDLTGSTTKAMEQKVQTQINDYFSTNLNSFSKVFRRSNLLAIIDDIDVAILNSKMTVAMKRSLIPTTGTPFSYTVEFPATLATVDDTSNVITSSNFTFNSKTCSIKNRLNSTTLEIVSQDGTVEIDNIGSYDSVNGTINLVGFNPTAFVGSAIDFIATPANQSTIRPLRNFVLNIDTGTSVSNAILDYQNTAVTL
tara:strand:- start:1485 stop:3314 length:1830 start_codon:yes stop_codon:yes gene_type:complete